MPEIEYIRPSSERPAKFDHGTFEDIASHEQQRRIEIALNRYKRLQFLAGIARRYDCIEADRINSGFRDVALVQETGRTRKADYRNVRKPTLQRANDALCRLDHPSPKLGLGQNA